MHTKAEKRINNREESPMKVSFLTGGKDVHYALNLLSGLTQKPMLIDFIGNDEMEKADAVRSENVNYFNLRGDQSEYAPYMKKVFRVLKYYFRLIKYVAETDSTILHINWLNKFTHFDRTVLNVYFKWLGKKIVYTAHDVNFAQLGGKDSKLNQSSLAFMYRIVDHIIVHTEKMKAQIIRDFKIRENKVTVIPFGINNALPRCNLTRAEAREKLGLGAVQKVLLFFGNIAPYKGLEYLIWGLRCVKKSLGDFKLVIAGRVKQNCSAYWKKIENMIEEEGLTEKVLKRIEFIPDEEVEIYFESADLLVLPYKNIFQSGLIFTAYNFGLPVIASNVGSLREDIVEGKTGFVCNPEDPEDLAEKIMLYFQSGLFDNLDTKRKEIIQYANERFSWERSGERTFAVYKSVSSDGKISK
jgi:glycosyltransferase involved in cell wall biosynthesis